MTSRLGGGNETQHQSLVIGHWSLENKGRRTKDKVGWVETFHGTSPRAMERLYAKPNINQLPVVFKLS